jgi:general secretion pathway protein G
MKSTTLHTTRIQRTAFTLMEMMLVLGIIGILVGISAVALRGTMGDAEETKAKTQIRNIEMHLLRFKNTTGGLLPTKLEGLVTKPSGLQGKPWKKFADEKDIIDPWGTPFIYRNPGKRNTGSYDVFSAGPDRKEGTDDDIWVE